MFTLQLHFLRDDLPRPTTSCGERRYARDDLPRASVDARGRQLLADMGGDGAKMASLAVEIGFAPLANLTGLAIGAATVHVALLPVLTMVRARVDHAKQCLLVARFGYAVGIDEAALA